MKINLDLVRAISALPKDVLALIFSEFDNDEARQLAPFLDKRCHEILQWVWFRRCKNHFQEKCRDYTFKRTQKWIEEYVSCEISAYYSLKKELKLLFRDIKNKHIEPLLVIQNLDDFTHADEHGDTLLSIARQEQIKPVLNHVFQLAYMRFNELTANGEHPPSIALANGYNILHLAVLTQQPADIITALLVLDCPVDSRDSKGNTSLHLAAEIGNLTAAQALLAGGARMDLDNDELYAALAIAAKKNHTVIVAEMMKHLPDELVSCGLYTAAIHGCVDAMRPLARSKKIVNDASAGLHGRTALHYAAKHGHVHIIEYLISVGAKADTRDYYGITPLHLAIEADHEAAIIALLNHHVDINAAMHNKTTPLYLSTMRGNANATRELLARNADIHEAESNNLNIPLLYAAAMTGQDAIVELLLQHHVNVNAVFKLERTALAAAVRGRHFTTAKILLEHGADPNIADTSGNAPLHIAAKRGDIAMIKLLLRFNANPHLKSRLEHATPRAFALMLDHHAAVAEFDKYEAAQDKLNDKMRHLYLSHQDTDEARQQTGCLPFRFFRRHHHNNNNNSIKPPTNQR